jgi:hypothetical protein
MEIILEKFRVMLIVSGVGNLSQTILWLGIIGLLWRTSLTLLKVLAAMISVMNLVWFIGVLFWYLSAKSTNEQQAYEFSQIFAWCACCYLVLFGTSHWIFVMNYLTLAIRIKYPDPD